MRVKKWFLAAAGIIFLEGVILIVLFFILPVDKVYGGMEYRIGDGVVIGNKSFVPASSPCFLAKALRFSKACHISVSSSSPKPRFPFRRFWVSRPTSFL